jgi:uncharacterized protein (TIGR03437 family)
MENFAPYSLNGDTDGAFNPANLEVGPHTLTITGYPQANLGGTPGPSTTVTFQVVDNSNTTPLLLTQENSDHAVAFNAATLVREPFSLFTEQNFSADKRTRVMLFVTDFAALNGDTMSEAVVQVENPVLGTVSLPIEHIAKVPLFDWLTQIQVVLPDSLANAGDVWVTISFRGASTNQARLKIKQAGVAAYEPPLMKLFKDPWIIPDLRFQWLIPTRRQTS